MLVSTEVRYNGRYIFTLAESRVGKKGFGGYSFITIKDLENNNKIVASIMIDLRKVDYRKTKKMPREYMLIEDDLNDKLWSEIFSELRALNNKWNKWLYLHNYLIISYLPIQKLEKIFPNISSFVICPVISPIESIAFLKSIDNKSPVIPFSIPFLISINDDSASLREL